VRIGIVAEGPTDHLVLEALIARVLNVGEFVRLYPDDSRSLGGPGGWQGVRAWCTANQGALEAIMRAITGREIDLLVIHIDCSAAPTNGIPFNCPPPTATAEALRNQVVTWLGGVLADYAVIATPSYCTDTWTVVALEPGQRGRADLECDPLIDRHLLREGRLRTKEGRVQKSVRRYEALAAVVASEADAVLSACSEAASFRGRLLAATPLTA
jgi:hypothetical protein